MTWNKRLAALCLSAALLAAGGAGAGARTVEEAGVLLSARSAPAAAAVQEEGEPVWVVRRSGGLQVVRAVEGRLQVETFTEQGNSLGVRLLPAELPIFGGFYQGESGYYAAYGQENQEESDGKEVYRIVRYDFDWERVGAASITGGASLTVEPFRSTQNTAMAESGGVLLLHTARLRYTSDDGFRHQSNFTAKVRVSDMAVLETSAPFPEHHVSHSFSQEVLFDGGVPVYADLGDAYPRSFALSREGSGQQEILPFYGRLGDNTVHATLGGLAASADHYLLAGSSAPQTDAASWRRERQNVLLAVTPKADFPNGQPRLLWLTGYTDGETWVEDVRLVEVGEDMFAVLWQARNQTGRTGGLSYALFDGQGRQLGRTGTAAGYRFPDGGILTEGAVLTWAAADPGGAGWRLYTLDLEGVGARIF